MSLYKRSDEFLVNSDDGDAEVGKYDHAWMGAMGGETRVCVRCKLFEVPNTDQPPFCPAPAGDVIDSGDYWTKVFEKRNQAKVPPVLDPNTGKAVTRHMRVRYKLLGGHYHVSFFTAVTEDQSHAKNGELVFDEAEWKAFSLLLSSQSPFLTVELIDETPPEEELPDEAEDEVEEEYVRTTALREETFEKTYPRLYALTWGRAETEGRDLRDFGFTYVAVVGEWATVKYRLNADRSFYLKARGSEEKGWEVEFTTYK